jgi:hypothetical protein
MCIYIYIFILIKSRDSAVGTAGAYGLDDGGVGFRVPVGLKFSLLHLVETGSGVYTTFYLMGNGGFFPGGKRGRDVKLTTHLQLVLRSRKRGSIHPLSHTSSWRSA